MTQTGNLLNAFAAQDLAAVLGAGTDRTLSAGETLFAAGSEIGSLVIVISGVLGVFWGEGQDQADIVIGPNQFIGEISVLERRPATGSVIALEPSHLIEVPHQVIAAQVEADAAFGMRFYRALASSLSQRLLSSHHRGQPSIEVPETRSLEHAPVWPRLMRAVSSLKELFHTLDQHELKGDTAAITALAEPVRQAFRDLVHQLHVDLGDESPLPPEVRQAIGEALQRELLPFVHLSEVADRCYSKPRGYAGDYLTIERIYADEPCGHGRLGPYVDRCFLDDPAARAVRNRRGLLSAAIRATVQEASGGQVGVTSLASGPAREIFDVIAELPATADVRFTLVDIDWQALAFVDEERKRRRIRTPMQLVHENLIHVASGRRELPIPPQDLIYSIGLIDYFDEPVVTKIINVIHGLLKPGGRVILGNFHTKNPSKALMDHVLDWRLYHRTEADFDRIFRASAFARDCDRFFYEEQGINMFAECIKA